MKQSIVGFILFVSLPVFACQFHGGDYAYDDYSYSSPQDFPKNIYAKKAKERVATHPKKKPSSFFKFKRVQKYGDKAKKKGEQEKSSPESAKKPLVDKEKTQKTQKEQNG